MEEDKDKNSGSVDVTMELSGEYDDVVRKISVDDQRRQELRELAQDFERLLDTIGAIDGGTKSAIVENLPGDMRVVYDSESVVAALQTLEEYGLVTLDGNTWKATE